MVWPRGDLFFGRPLGSQLEGCERGTARGALVMHAVAATAFSAQAARDETETNAPRTNPAPGDRRRMFGFDERPTSSIDTPRWFVRRERKGAVV